MGRQLPGRVDAPRPTVGHGRFVSQYDVGAGGLLRPKSPELVETDHDPITVVVSPGGRSVYVANNEAATYEFFLEEPNVAMAPAGDTIAIVGEGTFSTHSKSVSGGGTFTHTVGTDEFTGTWTAEKLIAFQPYGCGVIFGAPIPPELCGGRVLMEVSFVPDANPSLSLPGTITIECLIGYPPASAQEGVRVNVPGISNFNQSVSGMNVYEKE